MRALFLASVIVLVGCGSDDDPAPVAEDTGSDTGTVDTGSAPDSTTTPDSSDIDSTIVDSGGDASDTAVPSDALADGDAGGCPTSWTIAPVVDPSLAIPDGGGGVLLHAFGTGTQNYSCVAKPIVTDAGPDADDSGDAGSTYAWTLTGPEADLKDCAMVKIGTHFASDAGAAAPEWLTTSDGTNVIAKRNVAFTPPDGGSASVPWLLLEATSHAGTGKLSKTLFIQRVNTTGGNAPATGCDSTKVGDTTKVSYTADYYFFGTP